MAYASGNCEFFIENDEPRRINMKDAAKLLARNRQEMIANELSRLAGDEYLEDIMQHTRHLEVSDSKARLAPTFPLVDYSYQSLLPATLRTVGHDYS